MDFDADYRGARFFKCDLQMQTPFDRSWREDDTRLGLGDSEERKREVVRGYLERCHDSGLEVIAITDHNFARGSSHPFISLLLELNEGIAATRGRAPLIIFPGFEMEADVGKGAHVLCLFEPGTALAIVDSRVTACGLPPDRRFKDGGEPHSSTHHLSEVLDRVQLNSSNPGIVICPHAISNKGILSNNEIEIWLQQEEFTNSDLLCLELPKPPDQLSPNFRRLLGSGPDCDPAWRRTRPIACVLSSDCYRLTPKGPDQANYIGFRHTWIKMSSPSIEALRQAFLDHESRIRYGVQRPEDNYDHPRISSVSVEGATFYKADRIWLSPSLNCVIGSRGAGKSTLLDYLRWAFDRLRVGDLPERLRSEIDDRISQTLPSGAKIVVRFVQSEVPFELTCAQTIDGPVRIIKDLRSGEEMSGLAVRELLPVRVLSQREIDQSVDVSDRTALSRLLDDFISVDLAGLSQIETELRAEVKSLDSTIQTKEQGQTLLPQYLSTELDIEARISRLEAVKEPLKRWTRVESTNSYVNGLQALIETTIDRLSAEVKRIADPKPIPGTEGADSVAALLRAKTVTALVALRSQLEAAIDAFRSAALEANADSVAEKKSVVSNSWNYQFGKEKQEYEKLRKELEQKGDRPQDYLDLLSRLEETKQALAALHEDENALSLLRAQRSDRLAQLRSCWTDQTGLRRKKAQQLMEALRPQVGDRPLVEISVEHQGDSNEAVRLWTLKSKDLRRISDIDIATLFEKLQETADPDACLPLHAIQFVRAEDARKKLTSWLSERKASAFLEFYSPSVLSELEMTRVPDRVTYTVYREDGALVGPIEKVSAGQKGLAFLHLLLASGEAPILVDTPEEGLDNEGVFTDLVPIFRRKKETRQIFVITHNANIPVNADAELIICLEPVGRVDKAALTQWSNELAAHPAQVNIDRVQQLLGPKDWDIRLKEYLGKRDWSPQGMTELVRRIVHDRMVEGHIRSSTDSGTAGQLPCLGALDQPHVKSAVQDIMEGSVDAFQRRREMYGI